MLFSLLIAISTIAIVVASISPDTKNLRTKEGKDIVRDFSDGVSLHDGRGVKSLGDTILSPFAVYATDNEDLYFIDSNLHTAFQTAVDAEFTTVLCGDVGNAGFAGDTLTCDQALLNRPRGIWGVGTSVLFIADTHNHRIRQIDLNTKIITTIAGTGVQGYSGDGDLAINAKLYSPFQGWTSTEGKTYFTEFQLCVVRWIDADGKIYTLAGTGVCANGADGPLGPQIPLNKPWGIVGLDSALYVTEFAGHKVRKIDPITTEVTTVAGTGVAGFTEERANALEVDLNGPTGIVGSETFETLAWGENGNKILRRLDFSSGDSYVSKYLVGRPRGISKIRPHTAVIAFPARHQILAYDEGICFSGETLVRVLPRTPEQAASSRPITIAMKDLQLGDRLEVRPNQFEEVIEFIHRDVVGTANYLRISVEGEGEAGESEWVELSHRHLIRTKKGFVFADTVTMDDELLVSGKWKKVQSIDCVERVGIYAPSTWSGVFLADGIEVSCYAYVHHEYAFAYMRLRNLVLIASAPLRSLWSMWRGDSVALNEVTTVNIGEEWIQKTTLSLVRDYAPQIMKYVSS